MGESISVDRIEGNVIVAERENREIFYPDPDDFADAAVPGSCYRLEDDGKYHLDSRETENRRRKNIDLLRSLIDND